jgi:hypothetical protein
MDINISEVCVASIFRVAELERKRKVHDNREGITGAGAVR